MPMPATQSQSTSTHSTPAKAEPPDIATASIPNTLTALRVNPKTGLAHGEIDARRKEHGYNEVAVQKEHPLLKFLEKFWGLSAWMLELIMLLSFVLGHYSDLVIVGALLIVNCAAGICSRAASSRCDGDVATKASGQCARTSRC